MNAVTDKANSPTSRSPISSWPTGAARRSRSPRPRCPASWRSARSSRREQPLRGARIAGIAAHDDPDRRADRDAAGARRRRALGVVQHLLDAGPRRRRDRRARHAGVRVQGRDARRVLGLHAPDLRVGATDGRPEHDPRRRRRRDAARAPRHAGRDRPRRASRIRATRRRPSLFAAIAKRRSPTIPTFYSTLQGRHQGRHRRDDHRRQAPLPDAQGRPPRLSRRSTSTTR